MKRLTAEALALTLALLNILDAIFTLAWSDVIDEWNPIMKHLLENRPLDFVAIKLLLSTILVCAAGTKIVNKLRIPLIICVIGYLIVNTLHIVVLLNINT